MLFLAFQQILRMSAGGKSDITDQRFDPDTHHPLQNFSKDDVFAVQPWSHNGGDEELRAVGVFAGVCHAEPAGAVVLQLEVLIREAVSIDALAFILRKTYYWYH